MAHWHLWAIARRRGKVLEFYCPVARGEAIGWTDDHRHAWCEMNIDYAERVRLELQFNGIIDTFLYIIQPDDGLDYVYHDEG